MAKDNPKEHARKVFLIANKPQMEIILIAFLPSALTFLSFVCIVFIGNPDFSQAVFHKTFLATRSSVNEISETIVLLMSFFFLLSLFAAFFVSHKTVGALGRITLELDEIIAGRSQRIISSRPKDTVTKALLERVNVLVASYVKHEKKNS